MDWNKKKPLGGSKYGLQLKIVAPGTKKPQLKKPLPFSADDQDEYTVEDDIARQASKKQSAHEVDVQIKQALEQDSSAFDYDGVYDQMKGQQAQPIREERAKREPKYIGKLLDKAKVRAVEHDISFERRLAKEREKEEHLFGDKEKFVTSAYKKKLIEQGKWKEEERLRELREKAHEVDGKHDLSDFYRNLLHNNVAFGGKIDGNEKLQSTAEERVRVQVQDDELPAVANEEGTSSDLPRPEEGSSEDLHDRSNTASRNGANIEENSEARPVSGSPLGRQHIEELEGGVEEKTKNEAGGLSPSLSARTHQNSSEVSAKKESRSREESLATAKQRYLERKRQRKD